MRDGDLREKEGMPQGHSRRSWHIAIFAAAIVIFTCSAAPAKDSATSVKDAEQ
jgi:hypothetical protein